MSRTTNKKVSAIFVIDELKGFMGEPPIPRGHLIKTEFSSKSNEVILSQIIEEDAREAIETIDHADFWEHRSKYRITIEKLQRDI